MLPGCSRLTTVKNILSTPCNIGGVILVLTMLLLPLVSTPIRSEYRIEYAINIIEIYSIENYSAVNQPNLPRSHDAAQAFINKFSTTGISIGWLKDSIAEPRYWWTSRIGGTNSISNRDFVIFIGHGFSGEIAFGVKSNNLARGEDNEVYLDHWVAGYNSPEVHPELNTKWILLVACRTLYDEYPFRRGGTVYKIVSRLFNGKYDDMWDVTDTYLHVMLGMYTEFIQQDGWGIDMASPTLEKFANDLLNGVGVWYAWREAVKTHQRICYGPFCTWQGKAAYIAPQIDVVDNSGRLIARYWYGGETLYYVYSRPISVIYYWRSRGYIVTLSWYYGVYPP